MSNFENIQTGTVHAGRVRKLRADFTESGFVEWATADCEKRAAYRNINRMPLVATDADVTCKRCLALTAPVEPKVDANGWTELRVERANGYHERFKTERSAIIWVVDHIVTHELLGYRLDAAAVDFVKSKLTISSDELDKKIAAKRKRMQREINDSRF